MKWCHPHRHDTRPLHSTTTYTNPTPITPKLAHQLLVPWETFTQISFLLHLFIFTRESSHCFQRVLAIAILSVCPSHWWISQRRRKLEFPNFHCRLPRRLQFQEPKSFSILITNRKSYTGFRLALNSMTLNDLGRQKGGFMDFSGDLGLWHKSISFTRWRHATVVMQSR